MLEFYGSGGCEYLHEVVVISPGDGDERLQLEELFRVGDGSTVVCGLVSPVGWESPKL